MEEDTTMQELILPLLPMMWATSSARKCPWYMTQNDGDHVQWYSKTSHASICGIISYSTLMLMTMNNGVNLSSCHTCYSPVFATWCVKTLNKDRFLPGSAWCHATLSMWKRRLTLLLCSLMLPRHSDAGDRQSQILCWILWRPLRIFDLVLSNISHTWRARESREGMPMNTICLCVASIKYVEQWVFSLPKQWKCQIPCSTINTQTHGCGALWLSHEWAHKWRCTYTHTKDTIFCINDRLVWRKAFNFHLTLCIYITQW